LQEAAPVRKSKTVAIIGGGLAGLAAARLLCTRGVAVKLFEANNKVGGCCATTRLGEYTFNDGAVYLALPGMLDQLFHRLELDRHRLLPLRRISAIQTTTLPDGSVVTIGEGSNVSIECDRGTEATAKLHAELQFFLMKWDPVLRFFADDILVHPFSLPRFIAKGWRHLHMLRGTVASQLNSSFSSEAVRAAMAGTLLYTGVPPDKMPASFLLGLVAMFLDGYFLPEGGMGNIPETLSRAVRARGGDIHLNSNVSRVLVKSGRVYGVEVENAGVTEVDAVISTASAMHTYGSLLSEREVPARMRRKVRRTILSRKGFVLQLGLSNKINVRSYTNIVLPWLGDQTQVFLPDKQSLRWPTYMVPTVTAPELAPPGGSIVEIFSPISQEMTADDWNEERKEEVAAQAVERLKELHEITIAVRRILSPKEFQEGTHLYAGALYGLSPLGGPAAMFRHRSPVRGLYQAGQTTWPGFGVASAGMSGVFAAEAFIHDEAF
jgi:phytoene desaturase